MNTSHSFFIVRYRGGQMMSPLALCIICILLLTNGAFSQTLPNKVFTPAHYGGQTYTSLTLSQDRLVRHDAIKNNEGGPVQWVVEKDGQVVLQRSAQNSNEIRYWVRTPGVYKLYLQQFIDGTYQVISNVVGYKITEEGNVVGLIEPRVAGERRSAIIKLPMHRNYHEVEYQIRSGFAVYQGDIILGDPNRVQQQSSLNIGRLRRNELSKSTLRLAKRTKFPLLKSELQVEPIDKILERPRRVLRSALTRDPRRLWTDGRVPFEIAPNQFSSATTVRIFDAIKEINENTVVDIVWKAGPEPAQPGDDENFIIIERTNEPGVGGRSWIGRETGDGDENGAGQILQLSGSASKGTIIHEFLHALGFYHTQSRWDRDSFVCVRAQNSSDGFENNFSIQDDPFDTAYGAYDTESIMHYESCAFSDCGSCWLNLNSCATILPLENGGCDNKRIGGQRKHLSQTDIDAINWLYEDIGSLGTDPTAFTSVTVSVDRLQTTSGPEENGLGCNDDMDYYATLKIAPALYDASTDFFTIDVGKQTDARFSKIEGNVITPPNWQITLPLRETDRYILATVTIWDDDKSGVVGIGACGRDDDPVSVQNFDPRSTSARLLIDAEATSDSERIKIVTEMERIGFNILTNRFRASDTASLDAAFGDTIRLTGRTTSSHAANMNVVVDAR